MTLSIATVTYFEPYYLSGAKLTWELNSKFTFQLNAFNGFNTFLENNNNKTLGFAAAWNPVKSLSVSVNSLYTDESESGKKLKQNRSYTNLYLIYKLRRFTAGAEVNYGYQEHTALSDSTKAASMFSFLLALKFRITPIIAFYGRGEYFSDPDEILTGPVLNENHQLTGLEMKGITFGTEIKPIPNSYVRIEGRWLSTKDDEHIFRLDRHASNSRYEVLCGLGLWF